MDSVKHVVVLGHSGFIGQHLMDFVSTRYPDLKLIGKSRSDFDLAGSLDLSEVGALFRPDTAVVMLSGIKRQFGDNLETFGQNLSMVEKVCRILADHPVAKFVFFSSTAVYGEDIHNAWISESTAPEPTSYYGLAKYTSERLLLNAYAGRPNERLLVVRPPLIYGPGDPAETYGPVGFAKRVTQGEGIVVWGDGAELREFLYVRDAVELTARLITSDACGVLNLVSGESRSFRDILEIMEGAGESVSISSQDRTKDRVDHVFDPSLLRSHTEGFEFTPLRRGIESTVDSIRASQV